MRLRPLPSHELQIEADVQRQLKDPNSSGFRQSHFWHWRTAAGLQIRGSFKREKEMCP